MDYAIYRTVNGRNKMAVHRFTQSQCKRRAKRAALDHLELMWQKVSACTPAIFRNAMRADSEFSYDFTPSNPRGDTVKVRFFIARITTKPSAKGIPKVFS